VEEPPVDVQGLVLGSGGGEEAARRGDVGDRVSVAVKEEEGDRKLGSPSECVLLRLQGLGEPAGGGPPVHEGVAPVLRHDFRIAAHERPYQAARTGERGPPTREDAGEGYLPGGDRELRLQKRGAQDEPTQVLRPSLDVPDGDEPAQGVAEEEHGPPPGAPLEEPVEGGGVVEVVREPADVSPSPRAFAMAPQVARRHRPAARVQPTREPLVPPGVLAVAVDDPQPALALPRPDPNEQGQAIRRPEGTRCRGGGLHDGN